MKRYYPVLLDVSGKRCLVAGGGEVAERRVEGLLEAGAAVTVVSPSITAKLADWHRQGRLAWAARPYETADLRGAALAIAATNDRSVNRQVCEDARRSGVWANAADEAGEGDYVVPATVRRGRLYVAVSTTGASPALSAKLAEELADRFPDEYEPYLDFLAECRAWALEHVQDKRKRRLLLQELLQNDMLKAIQTGTFERRRNEARAWLETMKDE